MSDCNRFDALRDEEPAPSCPWGTVPAPKPVIIGKKLKGSLPDSDYLVKISRVPPRRAGAPPRARIEIIESKERIRAASSGEIRRFDVYYGEFQSVIDAFTGNFARLFPDKARWDVEVEDETSDFLNGIAEAISHLF